jgi:hypothetical protein
MAMTQVAVAEARRPDVEAWLGERHVDWEFRAAVALAEIAVAAGLANQARLEALDEEVVDRYSADMERGDVFPPVLLNKVGRKLVPLGGNHRLAAASRANIGAVPAYVVVSEPEMATRLMYEDNRRHGLPPSEEERLHQAVHLVNNGYKREAAAEVVGLSAGKVERAVAVQSGDRRAAELGIRTWTLLPKTVRWRLGMVRSDPVFAAAADLAATSAMEHRDVQDMVTMINRTRSDAEALALVGHITEERAARARKTAGGRIRSSTARSRLIGNLTGVLCADGGAVRDSCPDGEARKALARRCGDAMAHLDKIRASLR